MRVACTDGARGVNQPHDFGAQHQDDLAVARLRQLRRVMPG
jgi:hypothetical protein